MKENENPISKLPKLIFKNNKNQHFIHFFFFFGKNDSVEIERAFWMLPNLFVIILHEWNVPLLYIEMFATVYLVVQCKPFL